MNIPETTALLEPLSQTNLDDPNDIILILVVILLYFLITIIINK